MAEILTATASNLAGVRPVLDENGQITDLQIDINLSYSNGEGGAVVGRVKTVNVWALLSDGQKAAMQDIQNTISQYIVATFFT
jgi:hypothetical protein